MPEIVQIMLAVVGSSALFSFVQFLITRRDNKKKEAKTDKIDDLKKELMTALEKNNSDYSDRYDELKESLVDGLNDREERGKARYEEHQQSIKKLNEAILQLTSNDTEMKKYMKHIGDEIMGLAHDKLIYLSDRFQERGAITLKEKSNLVSIYTPYHDGLGVNGDGKAGYEYCMKLPVITEEEARQLDAEIRYRRLRDVIDSDSKNASKSSNNTKKNAKNPFYVPPVEDDEHQ